MSPVTSQSGPTSRSHLSKLSKLATHLFVNYSAITSARLLLTPLCSRLNSCSLLSSGSSSLLWPAPRSVPASLQSHLHFCLCLPLFLSCSSCCGLLPIPALLLPLIFPSPYLPLFLPILCTASAFLLPLPFLLTLPFHYSCFSLLLLTTPPASLLPLPAPAIARKQWHQSTNKRTQR